jgi:hypothetical protein
MKTKNIITVKWMIRELMLAGSQGENKKAFLANRKL